MTRAETLLWRYLKAHHVGGLGFRRQVPMRGYIADFVCHSARLVIELDGSSHDFASRLKRDQRKDTWLLSQGYVVLRFTNDQVLKELEGVVAVIRSTANERVRCAPPSLSLPHKGGGNPRTSTAASTPNPPPQGARGPAGVRGEIAP
jgi:very-short-patch-repair endonuclease